MTKKKTGTHSELTWQFTQTNLRSILTKTAACLRQGALSQDFIVRPTAPPLASSCLIGRIGITTNNVEEVRGQTISGFPLISTDISE